MEHHASQLINKLNQWLVCETGNASERPFIKLKMSERVLKEMMLARAEIGCPQLAVMMECHFFKPQTVFTIARTNLSILSKLFTQRSHQHQSVWAKLRIIYHCFWHKTHSMTTSFKLNEFFSHLDTTTARTLMCQTNLHDILFSNLFNLG